MILITVLIAAGLVWSGPANLNPRTLSATASVPLQNDRDNSGRSAGTITLPPFSVGGNLETLVTASLDRPAASQLAVTITSSDPAKLLLSPLSSDPSGSAKGRASITGTVAKGQGRFGYGFPGFWAQALVSSGSANITVTIPGYNSVTTSVTFTRSGFVLNTPSGMGLDFTARADALLTVASRQLDASGNPSAMQGVRGGMTARVMVTSATPATGTITGTPAVVQPGKSASEPLTFHSVAPGTTLLAVAQPNGFSIPVTGAQVKATVVRPAVFLTPQPLGYNLVAHGNGNLDTPAPAGGVTVTLTSADPAKVRLSASATAPGASTIELAVPAGSTALPPFYLQGYSSTGKTALTASAPGYTTATGNVALYPSAFVINSPHDGGDFSTTTMSQATPLTVSVWQLDPSSHPFMPGQLRPGATASVVVTSAKPGTGTIIGSPAKFQEGDATNTTLTFLPAQDCAAPCTSVLSVVQPSGYASPATGAAITATVNQPRVSIRMIQSTIGKDLQVIATGALDAPAPTDLPVTVSVTSGKALLSKSPTGPGTQTIDFDVPGGTGMNSIGFPNYYVQSLDAGGTASLTIRAPGFQSSTLDVKLAPSGFVLAGPNGTGADFGVLMGTGNVPLTLTAVVLAADTLAPTTIVESLRGGVSSSVQVLSSAPAVAAISGSPFVVHAGDSTANVTLTPAAPGQCVISVPVPAGFSSPSIGRQLSVTVN